MTSSVIEASGSLGVQQPRISHVPPYASSSGDEAISLARLAGVDLDPWQQMELRDAMGESPDWKCPRCTHRAAEPVPCAAHPRAHLIHPWAAFEVAHVVPRQNGKSELLVARQLAGLFLLESQLQIYSAHLFDTSMEIFRRLVFLVENCDDLRREVKHRGSKMVGIKYSHGEEGVELRDGRRIRFKARTAGGGRGFSCDDLYLDEATILPERFLGATVPTLSARANPQIWFAGSAPDEDDPSHDGVVLAKRRVRALKGDDKSLAYFEHSAEGDHPDTVATAVLDDPEQWALANPGLGIRITPEYVAQERAAMGQRQFAVERLGIGAWPDVSEDAGRKIPKAVWAASLDPLSKVGKSLCFVFDISPDRSRAAISVGSLRADRKLHGEVIEHGAGTEWIVPRLLELQAAHRPAAILWDSLSQANSLKDEIEASKLRKAESIGTSEAVQACGVFFDALTQNRFRHIGQAELDLAVDGAGERLINDGSAWLWSRRLSNADITPFVSVTIAVWAAASRKGRKSDVVDLAAAMAAAEQETP